MRKRGLIMFRVMTACTLVLAIGGCSWLGLGRNTEQTFDGVYFRGEASAPRNARQRFVASVGPVSQSMEGAIEAARYKGVQHCINYYGTSDIDWEVGPDTPRDALVTEGDRLTFVGTCRD